MDLITQDWAPNNKSVIYISDFESPQKLADFLIKLDQNDMEYNTYLDHKYNIVKPISNELLLSQELLDTDNLFGEFECYLCKIMKRKYRSPANKMANQTHYKCALQPSYPPMTNKPQNYDEWNSILQVGKCQAMILDKLLQENRKFTKEQFDEMTEKHLHTCLNI